MYTCMISERTYNSPCVCHRSVCLVGICEGPSYTKIPRRSWVKTNEDLTYTCTIALVLSLKGVRWSTKYSIRTSLKSYITI